MHHTAFCNNTQKNNIMNHQEYTNIIENSDTAILFIHGIAGTPNHFKDFIPKVPKHISVCNMLLDGHGKGVKDFSASSMAKWEAQVSEKIALLSSSHSSIYIVGHSMGTLFAIEQAVLHPNKIKALFLLAVPFKIHLKLNNTSTSLKVCFGSKIKKADEKALAAKEAYSIEADRHLYRYLGWIPRYLELFSKIKKTRKLIPRLSVPCFVFQSECDEVVAPSAKNCFKGNLSTKMHTLNNSGHYYYENSDKKLLFKAFENLFN